MEQRDNLLKRELYEFWGMHPNAKFSRPIISYALDCNKRELDSVLRAMVEIGLVETQVQNGVTMYSLTTNEDKRGSVMEFAKHNHYWF